MLPAGKYVVEVVPPPGYEMVKEEDKNILIGDNFIAPVTQQFGGLGNIFILPDQASVAASSSTPARLQRQQRAEPDPEPGRRPRATESYPGSFPSPSGRASASLRIVPDYISLFPQSRQVVALCRSHAPSLRPQGSDAERPDRRYREVLHLHLHPHRREVHRRHHRRLHLGIRSVLAAVR